MAGLDLDPIESAHSAELQKSQLDTKREKSAMLDSLTKELAKLDRM